MNRTMEHVVETAILHRKMIRDGVVVRAESRHFFPDNGWSTQPKVEIHKPKSFKTCLPRLAKGRNVICVGRTVYLA